MSFTDTRNEILRELTELEKEAVIKSQEIAESNQEYPDLLKSKPVQIMKQLQTRYQNFYEKRK